MNTTVNNLLNLFRLHTRRFIFFLQTKNINVICTRESRGQNEYIREERKSSISTHFCTKFCKCSRQRRWLKPKKKIKKKKIAFSSNYQYKSSLCDDRYYECGTSSNNSRLAYCRFNILFFLFIRFISHPRYRHLFDASFFWVPKKKKNTCTSRL